MASKQRAARSSSRSPFLLNDLPSDAAELREAFDACMANWRHWPREKTSRQLLYTHALRKQALIGDAPDEAPKGSLSQREQLQAWRLLRGYSKEEAMRRFITFLRFVSEDLLDVERAAEPPPGFPKTAAGLKVCPMSNTCMGCRQPLLNEQGVSLELELTTHPCLNMESELQDWLRKNTEAQRCKFGEHAALDERDAKFFTSYFRRYGGFAAATPTSLAPLLRKVLRRHYAALHDLQTQSDSDSASAALYEAQSKAVQRVHVLSNLYKKMSGRDEFFDAECTRRTAHCDRRRLADGGRNHRHLVVAKLPGVDFSVFAFAAVLRREAQRLRQTLSTGAVPEHGISARCARLATHIARQHAKVLQVLEARRLQLWRHQRSSLRKKELQTFAATQHVFQVVNAIDSGDGDALRELISRARGERRIQNAENRGGVTALMKAVILGDRRLLQDLLDAGVDVDYCSATSGLSALMLAAKRNDLLTLHFLLERGAASGAHSPLQFPLQRQSHSQWHLQHTALAVAARHGHANVVDMLCEHCRDNGVNGKYDEVALLNFAPLPSRATAAMAAAAAGAELCLKTILRRGGDKRLRDRSGRTAQDYARARGFHDVAAWLNTTAAFGERGVETMSEVDATKRIRLCEMKAKKLLRHCVRKNLEELPEELGELAEQKSIFVDLETEDGVNCLNFAARVGDARAVARLLRSGADADYQNRQGKTAMMFAAWNAHDAVVALLLGAGASAEIRDFHGRQASAYAFASTKENAGGRREILEMLARAKQERPEETTASLVSFDSEEVLKVMAQKTNVTQKTQKTPAAQMTKLTRKTKAPASSADADEDVRERHRCPKCTLPLPCKHFATETLLFAAGFGASDWKWGRDVVSRNAKLRQREDAREKAQRRRKLRDWLSMSKIARMMKASAASSAEPPTTKLESLFISRLDGVVVAQNTFAHPQYCDAKLRVVDVVARQKADLVGGVDVDWERLYRVNQRREDAEGVREVSETRVELDAGLKSAARFQSRDSVFFSEELTASNAAVNDSWKRLAMSRERDVPLIFLHRKESAGPFAVCGNCSLSRAEWLSSSDKDSLQSILCDACVVRSLSRGDGAKRRWLRIEKASERLDLRNRLSSEQQIEYRAEDHDVQQLFFVPRRLDHCCYLLARGRAREAYALVEALLDGQRGALVEGGDAAGRGRAKLVVGMTLRVLALIETCRGRLGVAIGYQKYAVEVLSSALGLEHDETLASVEVYARMMAALDFPEKATDFLKEVQRRLENVAGGPRRSAAKKVHGQVVTFHCEDEAGRDEAPAVERWVRDVLAFFEQFENLRIRDFSTEERLASFWAFCDDGSKVTPSAFMFAVWLVRLERLFRVCPQLCFGRHATAAFNHAVKYGIKELIGSPGENATSGVVLPPGVPRFLVDELLERVRDNRSVWRTHEAAVSLSVEVMVKGGLVDGFRDWAQSDVGVGSWLRARHNASILGRKGRRALPRAQANVRGWIVRRKLRDEVLDKTDKKE